MNDPFTALLFFVGGMILLYIVYHARLNLHRAKVFHNPSYQLGIVFGACTIMLGTGFTSFILWLLS